MIPETTELKLKVKNFFKSLAPQISFSFLNVQRLLKTKLLTMDTSAASAFAIVFLKPTAGILAPSMREKKSSPSLLTIKPKRPIVPNFRNHS